MDLRDAIALLDETCPNQELSPSLTPRTPRTPLTPYPRNKRARSKSSDNSSNYSNDRLSDRSFEIAKSQEKEKKRPFLKKLGISMTEDRPLLAKLAPRIIGKPYLEKIGPSRAVERSFLEKIGPSRTVDKFTFDTPKNDRRINVGNETCIKEASELGISIKNGVCDRVDRRKEFARSYQIEKLKQILPTEEENENNQIEEFRRKMNFSSAERRRSGKNFLLKMYSFETEDLEEATMQTKDRKDLRGSSMEDVLDSGPSSLPPLEDIECETSDSGLEQKTTSVAELVKCRVTTSEEIICSTTCLNSPREANSWDNSPRRTRVSKSRTTSSTPKTPVRRDFLPRSDNILRNNDSTPNSPIKRPISNQSPERVLDSRTGTSVRNAIFSPAKTRRQTSEDILDKNKVNGEAGMQGYSMQGQFERRGISSDNLLDKSTSLLNDISVQNASVVTRKEPDDSLEAHREYSRETFKQLQDKFEVRDSTETYAAFKRRTRGPFHSTIARQQAIMTGNIDITSHQIPELTRKNAPIKVDSEARLGSPTGSTEAPKPDGISRNESETGSFQGQSSTVRAVLKKQEGIDHPSDQDFDANSSLRRPKRRIVHEPSQETMDLLTELRKVKSLLKTPSWEKENDLDKLPPRLPKRVLLTDKEFCLSVERENSIRRPSRVISITDKLEELPTSNGTEHSRTNSRKTTESSEGEMEVRPSGLALFEKKCLSLDYADEEKPQKPEARAISLASARNLQSEPEEPNDFSDLALICDSKSYSSDVFNTPSDEMDEKDRNCDLEKEPIRKTNHCPEPQPANPDEQKPSPKRQLPVIQAPGRTSDLYEIISPMSTPFRVKKRLGKISVEDTVKPENFTLGSKVDCRSVAVQKRTKCFPL